MKRLLYGVALAALIAAPVWAQTPSDNQNNPSNPNAGNPPASAQAPAQNAPAAGDKASRKEAAATAGRKHHAMGHSRHMGRHMAKAHHARHMRMAHRAHHMQMAHWRHGRQMHAMWHAGMPRYGMERQYSWHRPHRMYSGWGWGWGPKHASTDFVADQLNRQQLGGVGYGSSMPAGPQPYAPMGY